MINGNILIVDDNEEILLALKMFLGDHFTNVHARRNPLQALDCLEKESINVFILDMNFSPGASSGKEGIKLMNTIRGIDPLAVIIIITADGDEKLAMTAMKQGANDFIQKPWDDQKLLATVRSAMELSKSRQLLERLRIKQRHLITDQHKDHHMVYGNSRMMRKVMYTVDKVAGTAANVMLLGENGTGKELVAREIHLRSERKDEVFIKVDLGSLSESLFES
jgi:DNA-binding NtrC family response regulator